MAFQGGTEIEHVAPIGVVAVLLGTADGNSGSNWPPERGHDNLRADGLAGVVVAHIVPPLYDQDGAPETISENG